MSILYSITHNCSLLPSAVFENWVLHSHWVPCSWLGQSKDEKGRAGPWVSTLTLYLSYALEFPNNILLKNNSSSKNVRKLVCPSWSLLWDFQILIPKCSNFVFHIFAIVIFVSSYILMRWLLERVDQCCICALLWEHCARRKQQGVAELCRTHTRVEAVPQEEVSHHNYKPNGYAASFFIQTPLELQGEAPGDEGRGLCVFVMGGEEQDHNV